MTRNKRKKDMSMFAEGQRIWIHDEDSDVQFIRLADKTGRVDSGGAITICTVERVGYDGSIIDTYQTIAEGGRR